MRKLAGALLVAGALHSGLAGAVGLGKLSLDSALGEPFDAKLKLMGVSGLDASQIRVKLASQDDFDRVGVDRLYFLTDLNFKVETGDDGTATIAVTSRRNVLEPFLDFVVAVEWPQGRVLREYTVLLDLPSIESSTSHSMASPAVTTRNTSADKDAIVDRATYSTNNSDRAVQRDKAVVAAQEGGSYRIQSGDTLWNIAKAARPTSGLSINQTMLAIQELNPDAFINNNINLLKAGKVLRLPTEDEINNIGKQQANQSVASQMDDWRKGVPSPEVEPTIDAAQARPAQQKAKEETSAGQLTLSTMDDTASDQTVGTAEETLDNSDKTGIDEEGTVETVISARDDENIEEGVEAETEQQIGAENESIDNEIVTSDAEAELAESKAREEAELKERLARVEELAETTQKIASLKDEQISTLQEDLKKKQAEEQGGESKTSFLLMLAGGLLALIIVGLFFLMRRGSQDKKDEDVFELETPVAASKPAPAPELVVSAESAPTEVIDAVEEEPIVAEDIEQDDLETVEEDDADATVVMAAVDLPEDETADTETIEALVDEPLEDIEEIEDEPAVAEEPEETQVEMPAVSAEAQTGDVVSEVDIYMSLGRHAQAVAMLEKAIADDDKNMKLRIKLLEVHVDNGDKAAFLKDYKALQQKGDHQAIGKAKELLLSVDNADAWLGEEKPAVFAEKPAVVEKPEPEEATQVTDAVTQADLDAIPDEEVEPEPEDDERIEVSLNDSDLDFLADNDEIATKLDLARAYIDMGDIDGARDILDEVLKEGDESAKNEAQKLLSGIQ